MDVRLGAPKRRSKAPLVIAALLIGGGALVFGGMATFRTGGSPKVVVGSNLPAIGPSTLITVAAGEVSRGLTSVEVTLLQAGLTKVLSTKTFEPQPAHLPWGPKQAQITIEVEVGKLTIPQLREGEATIQVIAKGADTWLSEPAPTIELLKLPVRLSPPSLEVTSGQTYVTQGGCEVVVYTVGESSTKDGVRAGKWFFVGYPLPGGEPQQRFALFAAPYDMEDGSDIRLTATDDVGNTLEVPFIDGFTAKPFKRDQITVSDKFMGTVVPRILANAPDLKDRGSLVDNYVAINSELRGSNDNVMVELAAQTSRRFWWKTSFVQMPAKVFSSFADRRTYIYEGREIDRQFHLGYDLASTKKASVPAANAGVVVLARDVGIYGNAVVIDHGYGLMTLYGHLSSIAVKKGEQVARAQVIGRTGATGLALGDHLHYAVLLHGLAVRPLEWWDGAWIKNRVAAKLGGALNFVDG